MRHPSSTKRPSSTPHAGSSNSKSDACTFNRPVATTPPCRRGWKDCSASTSRNQGFWRPPAEEVRADRDNGAGEGPGAQIGPYKLVEQIGEGGFGVVFLAVQRQPLRRTVALKILKPGMDTRQVVARFEAERQALALMDHRTLPACSTAAQTASGRPYSSWNWSRACQSRATATTTD